MRIYIFSVTALAVLLVTLAIGVQPPEPGPASVVIALDGPLDEPSLGRFIDSAADGADREFRSNLEFDLRNGALENGATLSISCDSNGDEAASQLDQFAENLVEEHWPAFVDSLRGAAGRTEADAQQRLTALDRLKQSLAKARKMATANIATTNDAPGSIAPQGQAEPTVTTGFVVNPDWESIYAQAVRMQTEREQLLTRLTTAHPTVVKLDSELALVIEQLKRTPRMAEARHREPFAEPAGAAPIQSDPQSLAAESARLEREVTRLERQHRQAQVAALQAKAALDAAADVEVFVKQWATRSPVPNPTNYPTLAFGFVLALVVGGSVAGKGVPHDTVLRDSRQAENDLSVPVIAVLPPSDGSPPERKYSLPFATRLIRRGAEVVILAAIFCVTLLVVLDLDFLGYLVQTPLEAFPEGMRRLSQLG